MTLDPRILAMIHDGPFSPPPQLPTDEEVAAFHEQRERKLRESAAKKAEQPKGGTHLSALTALSELFIYPER